MKHDRRKKLKPHETLDGLKGIADECARRRGHNLQWHEEKATEVCGLCLWCDALAVCIVTPAGEENILAGLAVNQECPHRRPDRQQGATP